MAEASSPLLQYAALATGPGGADAQVIQQVAESERRSVRMRGYDHYKALAQKYLPDLSPSAVAAALQNHDPDHPIHATILAELDDAMLAAAQGHTRGISPSERQELGGNSVMPDYLLGPGDQRVYEVLRDSNLINAAVGRAPVRDPRDLVAGKIFAADDDGNPLPPEGIHADLARAVLNYEQAAATPEKHSGFTSSPYPQHDMFNGTDGAFSRSGDGIIGQAVGTFEAFEQGSRAAARRTGGPEGNALAAASRWATNLAPEIGKQMQHSWASGNVNRASPMVPDAYADGTPYEPEDRQAFIDTLGEAAHRTEAPTIQEHAASQGTTYSPAVAWAFDMPHMFVDPVTPALLATGGALGAARHLGKGGRLLGALTAGAATGTGAAVAEEAAEPINYAVAAATFPFAEGAAAFKKPALSEMGGGLGEPGYREKYAARQADADEAARNIRGLRGALNRGSSGR